MRAHVIGAGLAGLAAALSLAEAGVQVTLYEVGPAAGGRCRSYFDRGLGCRIDNGNHMLLSGNQAAMGYLEQIGSRLSLAGPGEPFFPFLDLDNDERWAVRLSGGRFPWWILRRSCRVPGSRLPEYFALLALRRAAADATVATVLGRAGELYRRLLEPLAIAALNTRPDVALARLLGVVVQETLLRGGAACIPSFPRVGLSETFVDPALVWLGKRGGRLLCGRRIAGLRIEGGRVRSLQVPEGAVELGKEDAAVLAVPAWVAADLLPDLVAPDAFEAIMNVHFRIDVPPGRAGFLCLLGGTAEWIFIKSGIISITISAASRLLERSSEEIAALVWPDVRRALILPEPMPPVRVVKEKRATFAATAAQERRRPPARTPLANLALAGDWTATGLPATIEGAIRSGRSAAGVLLGG